jgi:hypothetical protein
MTNCGSEAFAGALARLAAEADSPGLTSLARRVAAPVQVAVGGRPGVGVRTVAAALGRAGVSTSYVGAAARETDAEVAATVWVLAEVAKPEDVAAVTALRAAAMPVVHVLNKADLAGFTPAGPLIPAHRRAVALSATTGERPEPMVASLALAALDVDLLGDTELAALRVLCAEPADLSSPDAFLDEPHRLPREVRSRMLERLDLFGIAHAVVRLREVPDVDLAGLRLTLRGLSRIDDVCRRIEVFTAQAGYRRVRDALTVAAALAVTDPVVADWLSADDTVLAIMTAAVAVVEAVGIRVDPADAAAAHLRRAVQWRDYRGAPVNALHRSCADDIVRGSLRLFANSGGHR